MEEVEFEDCDIGEVRIFSDSAAEIETGCVAIPVTVECDDCDLRRQLDVSLSLCSVGNRRTAAVDLDDLRAALPEEWSMRGTTVWCGDCCE